MKVLLNVAHSSDTSGKRSPDSRLIEYEFSRHICHRIALELGLQGIKTQIIEQKNANALADVVFEANHQHKIEDCILVSVHVNASGMGDKWMFARGWSAYTTIGQTRADKLASFLYDEADKTFAKKGLRVRKDMSDGDADIESNFYILRKTTCPSVLTENFFMDNKDDVEYLLSRQGQDDIVDVHVNGIKAYLRDAYNRRK